MLLLIILAIFTAIFADNTCYFIPAGSTVYYPNNGKSALFNPQAANQCISSMTDKARPLSELFACSKEGNTAVYERWDGYNCSGNGPISVTNIQLNGACYTGACYRFHDYKTKGNSCNSTIISNYMNEYRYWEPNTCLYKTIETCVDGQVQITFYPDSDCNGNAYGTLLTNYCESFGNNESGIYAISNDDNPCKK